MRLVISIALLGLAACASLDASLGRPPGGPYRIPGRAPDPMAFSAEEGTQAYAVEPGPGIGYEVQAALKDGEVRVIVVLRDHGGIPLRYDLRRLTVSVAEGKVLKLVGLQEDPSRRALPEVRARDEYRRGIREVVRGERDVITRRYRLDDADAADAARLLATLSLDDEVAAADQVVPVKLAFEKAR